MSQYERRRALREVVDAGSSDRKFLLAEVRYLDYHTESWGTWHQFSSMFHKRRSFAYEQEVRAVITWPHWEDFLNGSVDPSSMPDLSGLAIPVDLDGLIQSVVVSPNATGWFVDLVASVMRRYGLPRVPITSELTEEPNW